MKVRVLLNDNPFRMIPIGCAEQAECRASYSAWCGGVHAGDAFEAFDLDVMDAPAENGTIPSGRFDNDAPELWVLEDAFRIGNVDEERGVRWPHDARSMSIGDVVMIGEAAFGCDSSPGWTLLDADMVRSLVIRERAKPSS